MSKRAVLAVGAHPDDVELGAGGLLHVLASGGYDVFVVVLTDEGDLGMATKRREESLDALSILGISREQVAFAGFRDGYLEVSRDSVSKIRDIVARRFRQPDLLITHSQSDLHHDHRSAWQLAAAAVRNVALLGFPISNSFLLTGFEPALSHDVRASEALKLGALKCHVSQAELGRVSADRASAFHRSLGRIVRQDAVELFDLNLPFDAEASEALLNQLVWTGVLRRTRSNGRDEGIAPSAGQSRHAQGQQSNIQD